MTDDDRLLVAAAGLGLAAAWYWATQPQDGEGGFVAVNETLGELATEALSMVNIWKPPAAATPYLAAIDAAERKYGLPANMLSRLLYQESRFRHDVISGKTKSPVGAVGIAQFMPATARQFGINPLDPFASIDAAGKYLAQLYIRFGRWQEALAAYNWGQGNVTRKGIAKAPAETRNYFSKILADIGLN